MAIASPAILFLFRFDREKGERGTNADKAPNESSNERNVRMLPTLEAVWLVKQAPERNKSENGTAYGQKNPAAVYVVGA